MKKVIKKSVIFSALCFLLILVPLQVAYEQQPIDPPVKLDYLTVYSGLYGSSYQELYSVEMCESNGLQGTIGEAGEVGVFQYFHETWGRYTKKFNEKFGTHEKFDIHSLHDQIKLTAFAFSLGDDAKSEWTTWVAIKNGGIYKFTGRNGKTYTVHCKLQNKNHLV